MPTPEKSHPKFTQQQRIDAIMAARGLVSVVARRLKCHPDTVRNHAKRNPKVAAALVEARESTTDMAEASLFKAIAAGEPWAVSLYLKTIGKERGYVERVEQRHGGDPGNDAPIRITSLTVMPPHGDGD